MAGSVDQYLVIADARAMREVNSESVNLIITSPPYWQLKDYGHPGQIGFDDSYEEYINNLNLVWFECRRVLAPGCRLCINIGDQFARASYYGRYKVIPIRAEIIRFCETIGFDYMGAIIWQKVTTCNTTGGGTVMGSFPYPRNGIIKIDYEFILLFRKPGEAPKVDSTLKEKARLSTAEWNTYFRGHWEFPGERQSDHIAPFPVELPRRLIRMFSFPGETVLDPFVGSGSTLVAAAELGRAGIGYELDDSLTTVITRRLQGANLRILTPPKRQFDYSDAIGRLPYVFMDPHAVRARAGKRAKTFGSKLRAATPERETYHRVKSVLGPRELILDDGTRVRLLGFKVREKQEDRAMAILTEMVRGHRVYLRQDPNHPPADGTHDAYLYLADRTFVNARMLRDGVAEFDAALPLEKANVLRRAGEKARKV